MFHPNFILSDLSYPEATLALNWFREDVERRGGNVVGGFLIVDADGLYQYSFRTALKLHWRDVTYSVSTLALLLWRASLTLLRKAVSHVKA